MLTRYPAVAGQFYESDREVLSKSIVDCFLHKIGPEKLPPAEITDSLVGLVCPHAGYIYSGPVAAHSYYLASGLKDLDIIVIVGPNHYGMGSGLATSAADSWYTPFGEQPVDKDFATKLAKKSGIVDIDEIAHRSEHSIEVQLPFVQFIYKKPIPFVPVCMLMQDEGSAKETGEAIADLVVGKRFLLIASSDLTHYEPHQHASKKDLEYLKAVSEMNISKCYDTLRRLDVTACGYGAIATVITACKKLGVKEGRVLKYATSGDTSGNYSSVVGYPAVAFSLR